MNLFFRLADEHDSQPFADWIGQSTQIPVEDVKASLKENNPTSVTLVIEDGQGKPILFAPTYCIAMLGFLGFNPDSGALERARALEVLRGTLQAFWKQFGVLEVAVLTKEDYPVAQWAAKHGFETETRQLMRMRSSTVEGAS